MMEKRRRTLALAMLLFFFSAHATPGQGAGCTREDVSGRVREIFERALSEGQIILQDGSRAEVRVPPSEEAMEEIRQIGDAAISILSEYIDYAQPRQVELVVRFVGRLGSEGAAQPLARILRESPSPVQRIQALGALTQVPWSVSGPVIAEAARKDADREVQAFAWQLLIGHGPGDRAKEQARAHIRGVFERLLAHPNHEQDIGPSADVQAVAGVRALGDSAIQPLAEQLQSPNETVRKLAVELLGALGGDRVLRSLIVTAMGDSSSEVRSLALETLSVSDSSLARDTLRRSAEKDPDPSVRNLARSLVERRGSPRPD